jgi:hypothetical protein
MALPSLRRGDTGNSVLYLQERLNQKGFHVTPDSDFGKKTEASVRQFQASESLKPDGIVGALTWSRLQVETTAEPPSALLAEQRAWLLAQIPPSLDPRIGDVLEVACSALGLKEIGPGSNWGPEIMPWVGGYNEYWKIGDSVRRPWCVMFVASSIARGLGMKPNPSWGDWAGHPWYDAASEGKAFRGSSADVESWAKARGSWVRAKASTPAAPGAFFTMARGSSGSDAASAPSAGHTGLVVCDNGDGTVTTVEGNVSDKVGSNKRRKTSLRGWSPWT